MRTTVDIADDVLFAVRELAKREEKSLGQVLSELSRTALTAVTTVGNSATSPTALGTSPNNALKVSDRIASYGIHPLPSRGGLVSNEMIDRLRDAEDL